VQPLHDNTSDRPLENITQAGVWGKIPSGALEFPGMGRLAGVFTQREAVNRRLSSAGISPIVELVNEKSMS
jgi:hypothetical protein